MKDEKKAKSEKQENTTEIHEVCVQTVREELTWNIKLGHRPLPPRTASGGLTDRVGLQEKQVDDLQAKN
jgi:hypothetical protein